MAAPRLAALASRVLVPLLVIAILAAAWLAPLDAGASEQVEAGLKRALTCFAAARALNAVISVAQGTEVAMQPGGLGVVAAPGQALDPVNDLVEQFSMLMLAASVSFGMQLALIKMGSHWLVSGLLSAAALAWLVWRGRTRERAAPWWLTRVLAVLVLLRFAVPLVALGNEAAFRVFLDRDYADGQATLELSTREIAERTPAAPAEPASGAMQRLQEWWRDAGAKLDVAARLEALKAAAANSVDQIIKLIVVFVLQTTVLPLLMLWALVKLVRGMAAPRPAPTQEARSPS